MILLAFKNFIKSLKYVFITLGTMFTGLLFALSIGYLAIKEAIGNFIVVLTSIVGELNAQASVTEAAIDNAINDFIAKLQSAEEIGDLLTRSYYENTLNQILQASTANYDLYLNQIGESFSGIISALVVTVVLVIIFQVLGFILGFYMTNKTIRGELGIKRSWYMAILVPILSYALMALAFMLVGYIGTATQSLGWALLAFVVLILLITTIQLLVAFIEQNDKLITLKDVFNVKNYFTFNVSSLIYIVLYFVMVILLVLIKLPLVAIYLALALFTVLFALLSLNSSAYLTNLKNKRKNEVVATVEANGKLEETISNDKKKKETKNKKKEITNEQKV